MAKSETIGVIIQDVRPIETLRNDLKRQTVILLEPGFTDEFGEKKGRDNTWCVHVYGDRINTFRLTSANIGQKAKVRFAFASTESTYNGGITKYEVSVRLNEITIIQ